MRARTSSTFRREPRWIISPSYEVWRSVSRPHWAACRLCSCSGTVEWKTKYSKHKRSKEKQHGFYYNSDPTTEWIKDVITFLSKPSVRCSLLYTCWCVWKENHQQVCPLHHWYISSLSECEIKSCVSSDGCFVSVGLFNIEEWWSTLTGNSYSSTVTVWSQAGWYMNSHSHHRNLLLFKHMTDL